MQFITRSLSHKSACLKIRQTESHLSSIDDAHVHALSASMVKEGRVKSPAHGLIPPEGESNVRHTAADLAPRADPLDLPAGLEEVDGIVVVLSHACSDGEDVGVENDVLWVEAHLLYQDPESPLTDSHLQICNSFPTCSREQMCLP